MGELHRLVGGLSGLANVLLSQPESAPHPPGRLGRNDHGLVPGGLTST